ncbi:unnamed protein product [Closterium sp. NIES-53]
MDSERRRRDVIASHLNARPAAEGTDTSLVTMEPVAGEFVKPEGYSVVLPEKLADGKWNVYRSVRSPFKLVDSFPQANIKTLHDNMEHAASLYADEPCLGTRVRPDGSVGDYEWITYREAAELRTAVGSGFIRLGLQRGEKVGLYCVNRAEWVLTEQACYSFGFVSVPLYDTLGPDAVQYIMNHAEIAAVLCTRDKLDMITSCLKDCPSVRLVVVLGQADHLLPMPPPGVTFLYYSKLEAQGRISPPPFAPLSPDETCSICYTSGTTGVPKGAMLTQGAMVASAAGTLFNATLFPGDVYLSYLPLAHIYERMNMQSLIHCGAAIGFYQGDVLKLMEDLEVLRPTVFASVPRLYNRIYDRILATVRSSGGIREYLFNIAYSAKKSALEKGKAPSAVWDRLVFNKVKARLGGRVRLMITGASPISPEVLDFLRICFGARVCEGYGMTETTCTISLVDEDDTTSGHVGSPNPACEVKLVDVPEMDYLSSDRPYPRGEICVRGPMIIKGYYKDPKQTEELIDEDGWLHTGDIGTWLPMGRLKIIDRKKNIFKLSQGEYVAPEKIENTYLRSPLIQQCFVHGDSLNANLVAIVVVDPDGITAWAKSRGIPYAEDVPRLCQDPVTRAAVLADMDRVGQEAKLRGFEFVKAVHLVAEPFTLENGLLTPTFKVKRPQAKAYFEKEIDALYLEVAKKDMVVPMATSSKL